MGYKLPPESVLSSIAEKIENRGEKTYFVPSFTDSNVQYCVDMELGFCDCVVGNDGSPCKHQYQLEKTFEQFKLYPLPEPI